MVRENRIKTYKFQAGSLTADAGGEFDSYSENAINGKLQQIYWEGGNVDATGSLFISVSGTNQNLIVITSGTDLNDLTEEFSAFPRAVAVGTTNVPLSGANGWDMFAEMCMNSIIRVVGSGCGNGKSGLGLSLVYI